MIEILLLILGLTTFVLGFVWLVRKEHSRALTVAFFIVLALFILILWIEQDRRTNIVLEETPKPAEIKETL